MCHALSAFRLPISSLPSFLAIFFCLSHLSQSLFPFPHTFAKHLSPSHLFTSSPRLLWFPKLQIRYWASHLSPSSFLLCVHPSLPLCGNGAALMHHWPQQKWIWVSAWHFLDMNSRGWWPFHLHIFLSAFPKTTYYLLIISLVMFVCLLARQLKNLTNVIWWTFYAIEWHTLSGTPSADGSPNTKTP